MSFVGLGVAPRGTRRVEKVGFPVKFFAIHRLCTGLTDETLLDGQSMGRASGVNYFRALSRDSYRLAAARFGSNRTVHPRGVFSYSDARPHI